MGGKTLKEEYFSWLYHLVGNQRRSYMKLCKELHLKKFRWSVDYDVNRCHDGLHLREVFMEENDIDETHLEVISWLKADCTVFEVLVSLAQRISNLMYDLKSPEDDQTSRWFLELIQNLKLSRFCDTSSIDSRFGPVTEVEINEALEIWLDRAYSRDGIGGLFPLKKRHPKDQTRVELYYQMMYWLDENYGE